MAPRRFWTKGKSPCWSLQVASWLGSNLSAQEFCRQRHLSIRTFDLWIHHLVSSGTSVNVRWLSPNDEDWTTHNGSGRMLLRPRLMIYSCSAMGINR
ncbi:hypothetical protein LB565_08875 [Mesorhizobium sp. CA14]|uniref:IS66 family insertion sequence element accessory protein TnpA n=1 Tax=Mesorhizobium sp. CA14 TaxID=2876642 RepID=UPI001CCEC70D|nr:hypothetical protein [Mesorhizobium sp. CA14]MBZ9848096.1 hypothetical protein [Mesorhizobium sp. CA14]